MSDEPNFLSEVAIASLEIGLAIRLKTMIEPGRSGPGLEFLVSAERAEEVARDILLASEEWKKTRRH